MTRNLGAHFGVLDPMEYIIWTVTILLLLFGLVGSVLPLLPGTTLILVGVLLQKWLLPNTLSATVVVWVGGFWVLSILSDIACTLLGTKLLGGTKWGMAGASGGALAGMFFSLPALILGSMFGAMAAEKWGARRPNSAALRSGAGAAIGFVLGTFARFSCALVMVGLYGVAAISYWRAMRG